ncbi:hypothetical protein ASPZODRAFT_133798 [Penicilliopsis zonata CBS 506.65]|uniref:Arylsulfotransferase N-terminal domain-containing protein n=1 Tax=Penicilliopsis zonata CBS 506.65 TaxID=1073090 RepID=A0A1L9SFD7_9EURO|nr:hypothetical protein ASPZODRAFT_133798 [Penicilliopsis zonata CBS 506.65]OJJ45930.1 hypothetical protein ASPZODRAFT_133798 [Penicilliopsis zonata CBS 506.65]
MARVWPLFVSLLLVVVVWCGVPVSGDFVSTDYEGYNEGELGHRPHLEFHSSSEYAPVLQATIWDREAIADTGSHIFLRHDGNASSPLASPLVLDAHDLSAVYMNRSFKNVFGTRVQENHGRRYLTFWEGEKGDGIGDGYGLAFDENYRLAYKVWAQNMRVHSDLHEFAFTGNGTALVTGVNRLQAQRGDVPGWRGPRRFELLDAVFQEIDLESNEVLFDWRAKDHVNPMDSYEPTGHGWDTYHLNSIEKTRAGNYLISMRHTHSLYLIDGQTGDIIWTMGGRRNEFVELPPAVNTSTGSEGKYAPQTVLSMRWQHHARFVPGTDEKQLTLFDNRVRETTHGECDTECSRGIHIAIDDSVSPPTVQLLREFFHPAHLQAQSQGSVQPLAPSLAADGQVDLGNVFIGWGRCPTFTEHKSTGETIMDVQFSPWHSDAIPDALDNYRAYKMDWRGVPWWDPAIAPRKTPKGELVVYVSWNGATEVAQWVVRASSDEMVKRHEEGEVVASSPRTGFETKLSIPTDKTDVQYLWAEAVDKHGAVLRSTEVIELNMTEVLVAHDMYNQLDSSFVALPLTDEDEDGEGGTDSVADTVTDTVTDTDTDAVTDTVADTDTDTNTDKKETMSNNTSVLLGIGIGLFIWVMIIAAWVIWRRRREYNQLEADDFDLGGEMGLDEEDERDRSDGSDFGSDFVDDDDGGSVDGLDGLDDHARAALIPKEV